MKHSLTLHKKLYSLYKQRGITENRREIIRDFTNGRTENSSELSTQEIISLINILQGGTTAKPQPKTINKLFGLCYTYGWKYYDESKGKFVVDVEKLNHWLVKYGKYHKQLNQHNTKELGIVTAQFEKVVNSLLKSI